MNKIFVSIACFLDKDIVNTINDCLEKAKNPENIVFGICLQYDPDDDFLKDYANPQFKITKIHWKEAQGPTYARYLITKLVSNEQYFLQIDCHTRFLKNWDEIAINCWKECNDPRAVLTNFPISIERMDKPHTVPMNRSTPHFASLSVDSIKLGSVTCNSRTPLPTYYLSAALLFGPSQFIREVPYDPLLTYAYQTIEQQFYAVRLFTHGWNLYMPTAHILGTYYTKMPHFDAKGNSISAPGNHARGKLSWQRVSYYYGLKELDEIDKNMRVDISKYGLGNKRSLDDFFELHNESGCIQKIKSGLKYDKGKWSRFTYECTNQIFDNLISKNRDFLKVPSDANSTVDFKWNICPKVNNCKFQHYPQGSVSFIDNKKTFFMMLDNNNIRNGIPETYYNISDMPDSINKNYFLKYAGNNGGQNVFIYNNVEDIRTHLKRDNRPYIIQEEVDDILLSDNKKFILRNWIVIVDNKFYLSANGCCIVHEKNYDKKNLDRKAHIEHDISKIGYRAYNSESYYDATIKNMVPILQEICGVIQNKLKMLDNCFQVLGLDIIFNKNYKPYIIEANSWPNMSVPYGNYKIILREFFQHFMSEIVIPKLTNRPISETPYFLQLKTTDKEHRVWTKPNLSPNKIPIVLVSNIDKTDSLASRLRLHNLDYVVYNRAKIDNAAYHKMIESGQIKTNRYKLSLNQVALWQTHYNLWEKMVNENIEKMLILENNCKLVNNFKELYDELRSYEKMVDYDILYLGYSGTDPILDKDLHLLDTGYPRCTHSYIITRAGAAILLDRLKSIDFPFDELMGQMFSEKDINGFRTSLLLTYQDFQLENKKYGLEKYKN